jgi:hypothetical protein
MEVLTMTLQIPQDLCCMCHGIMVKDDHELVCQACGYVSAEIYTENEPANFKDKNGSSTSCHAPGLGTNAAEAASAQLKKTTKGHVLKFQENKYVIYAYSCLGNFLKSNDIFRVQCQTLKTVLKKAVNDYVYAKKMAREGIEETKITRVVNGNKENHIRYYSIDRIIEKTILGFCTRNAFFGANIKIDSFSFHKIVRHSTRGKKLGTIRENGYKQHNSALDVLSCLQHGTFMEKSHNEHFKKTDHVMHGKQVTYPTYQKYFVLGFLYCETLLKNNVKQNHVQRQNILRGDSRRCQKCNCEIKEIVKISYRDTKKQKHKKYTSVIPYHIIRINGRKVTVKGCLDYAGQNCTIASDSVDLLHAEPF